MLSGSRTNRTAEAKKTTGRRRLKMEMLENRFPMDATISGVVFNDLNGNSVQLGAGEVGIGGVTLQLFNDVNSNQTYEAGTDTLVGTATSSAVPATLGNYSFNVPAAGRYLVRQTPTPGFAQLSTQRTQAVEITALEFAQSTIITTIDTFDVQPQLISVLTTNPITDSATDAGILGTERDLVASRTAGTGDFQIGVDQGNNNLLRISTDGSTTGVARIIYDGNGASDVNVSLADGAFAPAVDITSAGTAVGMRLDMRVDANGASAEIILRSAGGISTTGQVAIPQVGTAIPVFFSFGTGANAFTGTVDLAAITSIELVIRSNPDADIDIDQVGTYSPFNETINLANVPGMTIGNQVFADRNNNGVFDNTGGSPEVGLAGITVQLFADTNSNGTFQSGTDLAALDSSGNAITTATDSNGLYTFANLAPGPYFVVIPSSQVGPNFVVSSTTPAGTNNVNRGVAAAVGVVSSLVTLVAGSAPTTDGDSDVNTDLSVDIGLVPQFDLTVTKTTASTVAVTGSTITYTVTARNDGPAAVSGVGILDNLPDGLRIISVTPVGSDVITIPASASDTNPLNPDDISITIGTLAQSATAQRTYSIVAEVLPITTGTGTPAALVNTVTISGLGTELQTLTNTATVSLPVQLLNDLVALKTITTNPASTATPAIAVPGSTITYTVIGRNDGPSRATTVRILDNVPDGIQILTATSSDVTDTVTIPPSALDTTPANADDITIDMGDLLVGAGNQTTITITAVVLAPTSGLFTNSATISSTNTTVNSEAGQTGANTAQVVANAQRAINLVAEKSITTNPASTANPAAAAPGSTITYTILARNDGPFAATTVQVVDDLPDGIRVLSASLNGAPVTVPASASDTTPANPDNITFAIGNLATGAGNQSTISIVAVVLPSTLGQFTNRADISATDTVANFESVPDTANNTSSITANAGRTVDLSVTKNGPATAISGNTITYTMTATNNGPSDAIGVQVVDNIPDGIRVISATVNGVATTIPASASDNIAANNDDITFLVGNLGASAVNNTITIVAAILPSSTGSLVNSAVISTTDINSVDPVNTNSASITTTLTQQNDVTVDKIGQTTAEAGKTITYTMNVTNNGPSTATSIALVDTLPTGVTFVSGSFAIGGGAPTNLIPGTNNASASVTIPSLVPGETAAVTLVARVGVAVLGNVTNSVTVTAANDNVPNNTDTVVTNITAPAATTYAGRITIDSNFNGSTDANDAPVEGTVVTLTGTPTGAAAPITRSTTTNRNGEYSFENVETGIYTVSVEKPRGALVFRSATASSTTQGTPGDRQISGANVAGVPSAGNDFRFTRPLSKRSFLASTVG